MKLRPVLSLLMIVALSLCAFARPVPDSPARARKQREQVTAFVNVNVVTMERDEVLPNRTVIVREGRISQIGPTASTKIPAGAQRLDGQGKYLMPGLVDMHVHLHSTLEFPLYLANGVTTVYNLNGRPAHLAWRDRVARGELIGPTIYTCGPTIRSAQTAAEARQLVEEQARAGYDSIKIYNGVSTEAYETLIAEAKRHNLLYVGHIPRAPGLEGVLKAGQAIAHAEEYIYTFFHNKVDDESRIPEAAAMTRDAHVPVILTLVAYEHILQQATDLRALLARPETKYLAPWIEESWEPGGNPYEKFFGNEKGRADLARAFAFQKKLVQELHRDGVRVMVGTDAMNPGVVPGFSVHEELRHLVSIGFTPFEALRAATAYPADFLRGSSEFGTVTVGKRADLMLVEGNPLKDVSTAAHPVGVMARGRWLPSRELARMLADVPVRYAKQLQAGRSSFERDPLKALQEMKTDDAFDDLSNTVVQGFVVEKGTARFRELFALLKERSADSPLVSEAYINGLGYSLMGRGKMKEAIDIFKLNTETYPASANTYDSLAEAYMNNGERELAIKFYRRALEVDPKYANAEGAMQALKKLEEK
jgi:cytosine/adenosine deaminase-related metal-dependent hydrolase